MLALAIYCGGILNFCLPLFFKERFHGDMAKWGLILSMYQAGSFLATILLPFCIRTFKPGTILCGAFIGSGMAMALVGVQSPFFLLCILLPVLGCGFTPAPNPY